MLVPDTALADPGKRLARIAGFDLNLVGAVGHIVLLAIALALLHGSPRAGSGVRDGELKEELRVDPQQHFLPR
jgi:hypothetical protein